ncbi:hypothetical protein RN607_05385 [Demequina capsici]|uniref:Holin n=1 Tax=Demequina capsici TaxID=3075620 RepID=A0AA96FF14_9MICO|nr:hypothetical protein [Demequina sp. PMTSA13]WNM28435.1 hypothetical protein RN607_05385 [Demequina sp. PMTSA13]
MRSETVLMLSVRPWTSQEHTRFWLATLAPALTVAAVTMLAATIVSAVVDGTAGQVASAAIALCGLAYPAAVAGDVARRNPPPGFDVVATEIPAAEHVDS